MAGINLTIDRGQLNRVNQIINSSAKIGTAIQRAVNRGLESARTEAAREIRTRYDIAQANLRANQNVTLRKAVYSGDEIVGEIRFSGQKIPLYRFHPNPKNRRYTQRFVNGVSGWRVTTAVSAADNRGQMTARPEGFIATFRSGHTGIFQRIAGSKTSSGKEKLREYMSYSVADMLDYPEAREAVERKTMETVQKRLDHEIQAVLKGGY